MYVKIGFRRTIEVFTFYALEQSFGFKQDKARGIETLPLGEAYFFGDLPGDQLNAVKAYKGVTFVMRADPPQDGDNKPQDTPV